MRRILLLIVLVAAVVAPLTASAGRGIRPICTSVNVRLLGYPLADWDAICVPPCLDMDCMEQSQEQSLTIPINIGRDRSGSGRS